jgi:hypothetical protein
LGQASSPQTETSLSNGKNPSNKPSDFSRCYGSSGLFWTAVLGISKAGDVMLRRLLVGSAHYILGPFGPDTDLRRYGLRLCERGGKNAKKRAAVAVARKLAVLLHRLWISGEVYEPLRSAPPAVTAQEAAA